MVGGLAVVCVAYKAHLYQSFIMRIEWATGKLRPHDPLEVTFRGRVYKGWVSDIFNLAIARAEAEGERLEGGWEHELLSALQSKYPNYIERKEIRDSPPTLNIASALGFLKFVMKRGFDRSVVSTQEADRRAAICARCPKAGVLVGCGACKSAVRAVAGAPRKEYDFGKDNTGAEKVGCSACGCFLEVKVWMPGEYLKEEVEKHDWWEECWMRDL